MWVIINLGYPAFMECGDGGDEIPGEFRPTYLHFEREEAERECLRLAKRYPGGEFHLFEAIAKAEPARSDERVIRLETLRSPAAAPQEF